MYLSNSERIRLGLQHYGSDVPDHVVAAAEAALAGSACPAPAPQPPALEDAAPKKRTSAKRQSSDAAA